MAAKVLPDKIVERLRRAGKGPAEISRILRSEHGVDVTPAAISVWASRRGETERKKKYDDLFPWTVSRDHYHKYPAVMLRMESRRRAGEPIPPHMAANLDRWIKRLKDEGLVVHYDRDLEPFWFYVDAEEGDDLVHRPDEDPRAQART